MGITPFNEAGTAKDPGICMGYIRPARAKRGPT
jgi:hypothetical protein